MGAENETRMVMWPEVARRYAGMLRAALRLSRAELAHYVGIVEEREYGWMETDDLRDQVEALSIENDGPRGQLDHLSAEATSRRRESRTLTGYKKNRTGATQDGRRKVVAV